MKTTRPRQGSEDRGSGNARQAARRGRLPRSTRTRVAGHRLLIHSGDGYATAAPPVGMPGKGQPVGKARTGPMWQLVPPPPRPRPHRSRTPLDPPSSRSMRGSASATSPPQSRAEKTRGTQAKSRIGKRVVAVALGGCCGGPSGPWGFDAQDQCRRAFRRCQAGSTNVRSRRYFLALQSRKRRLSRARARTRPRMRP